jgi:formate--tetrahydrofolate ligase
MEDFNLHLTGDVHAISLAHNLLAAMIDNSITHANKLRIDPLSITWPRVVDVSDRALRKVVIGLGGRENGQPRETGFDIAVASEVMAILGLTTSMKDFRQRLGRIVIGLDQDGQCRHRRAARHRGGHGGAAAGHHQADAAADGGEHAGLRARRALREHRARQ